MVKASISIATILMAGLLISGCTKNNGEPGQFIVSSDEEGVICSAKSTFNDTIFYENRFPDTTIYYYVALTKQENEELKKSIVNLKLEKSIPAFDLKPGGGIFIVEADEVKFYEGNYSIPSHNTKKIFTLFREKAAAMKTCKKVENFWNIEGVNPPDNPIVKVE